MQLKQVIARSIEASVGRNHPGRFKITRGYIFITPYERTLRPDLEPPIPDRPEVTWSGKLQRMPKPKKQG